MEAKRYSNKYNYDNISAIRKALKDYFRLESRAESNGNFDALATLMDLKASIGFDPEDTQIITPRQKECIMLCLVEDQTEIEAAKKLGISQQAVFYNIRAGLRRIQKYLSNGTIQKRLFTLEVEAHLIALYKSGLRAKGISARIKMPIRTIQNKLKYLKKKGKLD